MDLSFNLAPNYRDLKDPTSRQNFEDTVEQKRVIDLRTCHILEWSVLIDIDCVNLSFEDLFYPSFTVRPIH